MKPTRSQIIADALDKATAPKGPQTILQRLNSPGRMLPGEATKLMSACTPQEQALLLELHERANQSDQYGKYARETTGEMLERMDAHPQVETFLNAMDTDLLTAQLIERRGGSDDRLPIPPVTRADVIGAAFDAHSGE